MDKITRFLARLFKWIRERYHGKDEFTLSRAERRMNDRIRGVIRFAAKYSGRRRYTPAPAILY